jgi:hypothetical protein
MRFCTVQATAVRQAIFKQKKGSATISLDLIYHSIVLSQPPSRDTVPYEDVTNPYEKNKVLAANACVDYKPTLILAYYLFLLALFKIFFNQI